MRGGKGVGGGRGGRGRSARIGKKKECTLSPSRGASSLVQLDARYLSCTSIAVRTHTRTSLTMASTSTATASARAGVSPGEEERA